MSRPKVNRNWKNFLFIIIIIQILIIPISNGDEIVDEYNEYLSKSVKELGFNGGILVIKDGEIEIANGYGYSNIEDSTKITPDTKFMLCSVTKQFTAAAVLQLAESDKLSLDDPITKYISNTYQPSLNEITIYNLLTQTSGLVEYLSLIDSEISFDKFVPKDEIVSLFLQEPLESEPGSKWQYSNSNYYLLGFILEKVTGLSYQEYLNENIFKPLQMNNSGFPDSYLNDITGTANGYSLNKNKDLIKAEPVHSNWPYSAGGLYSTINDMVKWDKALRDESILNSESLEKMFTRDKWKYGCGWEIDSLYGHKVVSHGGIGGGYCSQIVRFVDYPVCVVVFSNFEHSYKNVSQIAYDLISITFGKLKQKSNNDTLVFVDSKILQEYEGEYELAPGIAIKFTARDGNLYTQAPGQKEVQIYPHSQTEFYLQVVGGSVQFVRDSLGVVSSIIINQNGREIEAKKRR